MAGKPLIAWSIEAAKDSIYLDKIVVSTNDEEIAIIARQYGALVPFKRPEEFATDTSTTYDVINHAIDFFQKNGEIYDYLMLLEPTSPLRKKDDIDNAIKLLIDANEFSDSLISVGEVHLEHPDIVKIIDDGFLKPFIQNKIQVSRRQERKQVYFPYGVVYLAKVQTVIREQTFYTEKTIPYIIERWQNYEVDDIYDFICIENILIHNMKSEVK